MKLGRNDLCPCGSGKKYKNCCAAQSAAYKMPNIMGGQNFSPAVEIQEIYSLFHSGRIAQAEQLAQRVTKRYPNEKTAWKLLGLCLMVQGKEALAPLRQAAILSPDDPELHNRIGVVLIAKDRVEEAEVSFLKAIKLNPLHVDALYNLNLVLMSQGRIADAEKALKKALEINPSHAMSRYGMGLVEMAKNDIAAAQACFHAALVINPNLISAHYMLGELFFASGKTDQAEACFRKVLELSPDSVDGLGKLGWCLFEQGDLEGARAHYLKAFEISPGNIDVCSGLIMLDGAGASKQIETLAEVERAIKSGGRVLNDQDKITLSFSLGLGYQALKDFDRAFPYFQEGCRIKRAKLEYDSAATSEQVSNIIHRFDEQFVREAGGQGDASGLPIFILGMPRSGTTLVEQILSSHPQVHGGGELGYVYDTLSQGLGDPWWLPAHLQNLSPQSLADLGGDYLKRLGDFSPRVMRATDKMPMNFMALGAIHLMLPGAKIIHVVRNPVDNCVSCFTQLFRAGMEYSYDLAELGQYYADYHRLMAHWKKVLPDAFIEVRYEDVVADTEGQARRLLQYCGLEWDGSCLNFHRNQRTVRTASLAQVRQPIYKTSVERWRSYETFLAPLHKELQRLLGGVL